MKPETIRCAAILHNDIIYSVRRPGRHGTVIRKMNKLGFDAGCMINQGFKTSTHRFVDRQEAAQIAVDAAQINEPVECLYSEDIW